MCVLRRMGMIAALLCWVPTGMTHEGCVIWAAYPDGIHDLCFVPRWIEGVTDRKLGADSPNLGLACEVKRGGINPDYQLQRMKS